MTKKILITGKNSYIGTSFIEYCQKNNINFDIEELSVHGDEWKQEDFSKYDAVFHVAGVVHRKEGVENRSLYYKVNRDLAYEVGEKAKAAGVKQFIFLSTMSVYGIETGTINEDTPTCPKNAYGKSKLEAEHLINTLQDDDFLIAVIRPPMVYGKGCKGNYPRLAKLAVTTPIFPKINNQRSMIYIDNLSEFIRNIINNQSSGLFLPQNKEYVNTSEMVGLIAEAHGKQMHLTKIFNPILRLLNISILNKMFGDLIYDQNMSIHKTDYRVVNFKNSIRESEMRE